jgi:hypothetical protein
MKKEEPRANQLQTKGKQKGDREEEEHALLQRHK